MYCELPKTSANHVNKQIDTLNCNSAGAHYEPGTAARVSALQK
jgi:hypothetical protein